MFRPSLSLPIKFIHCVVVVVLLSRLTLDLQCCKYGLVVFSVFISGSGIEYSTALIFAFFIAEMT